MAASSTSEGKSLGFQHLSCLNCEEKCVSGYCHECRLDLCPKCENLHSKSSVTRNHAVVPIDQKQSTTDDSPKSQPTCAKHYVPLKYICKTCLATMCYSCKVDHTGHTIVESDQQIILLQKLCIQNIPGLMDLLHNLEQSHKFPGDIDLYKKARALIGSWRTKIISITNAETDYLLQELDSETNKHETLLKEHGEKRKQYSDVIDHLMTRLSSMRRVADEDILVNVIYSNRTMDEIKTFLSDCESKQETANQSTGRSVDEYEL